MSTANPVIPDNSDQPADPELIITELPAGLCMVPVKWNQVRSSKNTALSMKQILELTRIRVRPITSGSDGTMGVILPEGICFGAGEFSDGLYFSGERLIAQLIYDVDSEGSPNDRPVALLWYIDTVIDVFDCHH